MRDFDNFAHFFGWQTHLQGNFVVGRVAAQLLNQAAAGADQAVDSFNHMYRDTNGTGLVSDGAGDSLANPPGRISGEFVALAIIKLFDSPN